MAQTAPLTLAVIDDDADVRKALSRLLRVMGHDVRLFASAEEFEAQNMPVDCAIVDIRLPGLNGIELRERLRGRPKPIPVVLITGDGDRLARDVGLDVDAPLLTKPFDAAVLVSAIAAAISVFVHRGRHAH